MTRNFNIQGIGDVKVSEEPEDFALKIQLADMKISREIKFFSVELLNGFFNDITENHAKDMALATIKNKIKLSLEEVDKKRN